MQQPWTPSGVQAKLTELYALSDSLLLAQANLIRSNLRQWVIDNFTLNTTQTTYLNGIDNRWIQFVSAEAGFAVENRRPVTLTITGTVSASKLVRPTSDLSCSYSLPGGFTVSGQLTIEVVYS
jgi:hypothetical protein